MVVENLHNSFGTHYIPCKKNTGKRYSLKWGQSNTPFYYSERRLELDKNQNFPASRTWATKMVAPRRSAARKPANCNIVGKDTSTSELIWRGFAFRKYYFQSEIVCSLNKLMDPRKRIFFAWCWSKDIWGLWPIYWVFGPIPDICQFWYTTDFFEPVKEH